MMIVDPLNANVSIIAESGGDYTNLVDWEAATDNDLVAAQAGEVAAIRGNVNVTSSCTVSGATTDENYFRMIRPEREGDSPESTNQGFKEAGPDIPLAWSPDYAGISTSTTFVQLIRLSENNAVVQGLMLFGGGFNVLLNLSNSNAIIHNIIGLLDNQNPTKVRSYAVRVFAAQVSNIFIEAKGRVNAGIQPGYGGGVVNCAVKSDGHADNTFGFNSDPGAQATVHNCWSDWSGDGDFDPALGGDYNASINDATSPGANSLDNVTLADAVIDTATDFRPKSGGSFDGNGRAVDGFLDDIFGQNRGGIGDACEIGPNEVVTVGNGPVFPILQHKRLSNTLLRM